MRCCLLGSGYVGMALLQSLNGKTETTVTTTTAAKLTTLQTLADHAYLLRASDQDKLTPIVDQSDVLVITVAPKDHKGYRETYLETAHFIKKCLEQRTRPLHLIYTSSTSVYSGCEKDWVDESLTLHPASEQGRILLEAENVYMSLPVDVCIFRLGGIYGPGRSLQERARRLSGKEMSGSGRYPTNNIHQADIVNAVSFTIENRLKGIYNLVEEAHPVRAELYAKLCQELNLPPPIWTGEGESTHGSQCKVSNAKLRSTGFAFVYNGLGLGVC